MADIPLTTIVSSKPLNVALEGGELIFLTRDPSGTPATAIARFRQLSATPINDQTGSSYSLALNDQGRVVNMTSTGGSATVTVPSNASVAFPVGATLLIRQSGTAPVTIAAAGGVTIRKTASVTFTLSEQYAQAVLHKTDTNTWHLTGELTSA